MRAYTSYLSFAIVWSLIAALQAAGFHPFNVGIASVSGIGGFLTGTIAARGTIREIEKKGEYHTSRNRLILTLGVGLVIIAVSGYVIETEAVPLSVLSQVLSVYGRNMDRNVLRHP
ncbi:hypothetical protein AUF78_03275 [archaeon 13_1_20CM_2_51_12]|nr:MAG: hypothetical protein AUF78_03275 [archaeon 13_1_20CM_2_51_12]